MAKKKKTPLRVVYQSVWSENMTDEEKKEARRRVDDAFDFIFRKTIERIEQDQAGFR